MILFDKELKKEEEGKKLKKKKELVNLKFVKETIQKNFENTKNNIKKHSWRIIKKFWILLILK